MLGHWTRQKVYVGEQDKYGPCPHRAYSLVGDRQVNRQFQFSVMKAWGALWRDIYPELGSLRKFPTGTSELRLIP